MKKVLVSCTLILAMLFAFAASVSAADGEIVTVNVNGAQIQSDVDAFTMNDRTMLPFRAILNALGVSDDHITWDERVESVEVSTADHFIFMYVGWESAIVDDVQITLDCVAFIKDGRTFVPVRFIAESLGAEVLWDEDTKTVSINK